MNKLSPSTGSKDPLNELYGIKIFTDNRIKRGKILPYKNRTDSIRCSKATLNMLNRYIDYQDYYEFRQNLIWSTRYGVVFEKPKNAILTGVTTA